MSNPLNISRVSQLTGASPKAIRHYEAIGLIADIQRKGSYRTYSARDVNLIHLIRVAQKLGFKLSELGALVQKGRALTWQGVLRLVEQKHATVLDELARLNEQREQLNRLRVELLECLDADEEIIDLTHIDCDLMPGHVSG